MRHGYQVISRFCCKNDIRSIIVLAMLFSSSIREDDRWTMDEATLLEIITNILVTFSNRILEVLMRLKIFTRWTIITFVLILWLASFSTIFYYVEYDLDPCIHGGCKGDSSIENTSVNGKGGLRKSLRAVSSEDKFPSRRKHVHMTGRQGPNRKLADTDNPIYFLHIGKTGGSSLDSMMKRYSKTNKSVKKLYWGYNHFDWSYIEQDHRKKTFDSQSNKIPFSVERTADVVTFLRHPVSRSISQFYFGKTLPWAKKSNATFLDQSLEEYLHDADKTWMQPLNDGEGGVDFLAGTFSSGGWVMTDEVESEHKEYLRRNKTAACLLAAKRLEQTVWFGILEDVDRSMKLLQISFGLDSTPVLPKKNQATKGYPEPSDEIKLEIEKLLPKDMWLYEFAKRLFDARWNYAMQVNGQHKYVPPILPPLPKFEG